MEGTWWSEQGVVMTVYHGESVDRGMVTMHFDFVAVKLREKSPDEALVLYDWMIKLAQMDAASDCHKSLKSLP